MKAPISNLKDADMRAAPNALMRAAESARRLAERTGTPFVVRQPVQARLDAALEAGPADADASGPGAPANAVAPTHPPEKR